MWSVIQQSRINEMSLSQARIIYLHKVIEWNCVTVNLLPWKNCHGIFLRTSLPQVLTLSPKFWLSHSTTSLNAWLNYFIEYRPCQQRRGMTSQRPCWQKKVMANKLVRVKLPPLKDYETFHFMVLSIFNLITFIWYQIFVLLPHQHSTMVSLETKPFKEMAAL